MKYDTDMHLPQQIEHFLNAYTQGNIEILERSKKNIINLINVEVFNKDIEDYEQRREKQIKKHIENTLNDMKKTLEKPNGEETLIIIQSLLRQLEYQLNKTEGDYWTNLNEYITGWVQHTSDSED